MMLSRFARRRLVWLDCVAIVAGYGIVTLLDRPDQASWRFWPEILLFFLIALGTHVFSLRVFGLYDRMWRHAGIQDVRDVLMSSAVAVALLTAVHAGRRVLPVGAPLTVIVFGGTLVTFGVGCLRFGSRLSATHRRTTTPGLRVAVIGSRDAGAAVVRDMLNNPRAGLVPVAVFDDDCAAHGLSLLGVPVVGPIDTIARSKESCGIEQVVLAIPSPSANLMHRSLLAAEAAGVTMRHLPGMRDLAGRKPKPPLRHPRQFRIEDLLGRPQVSTDLDAVARSLSSGRVLITGAGGSIGSEIARQVAQFDPELVILLDRDETHLYDAVSTLSGNCIQELVDIRDLDGVFDVMARYEPSVVFHAAAHKHVPILEAHPIEATKTNVFGTLNVVEAAAAQGVPRFVMISTDKAVRPTSVMGATKLIGETFLQVQAQTDTIFCAVRFGNVLGSRGSVIPTFSRQIAAGGPVTVTDPLMTRYFMSVEEAVQLVLQASLLASGGDVFMLDMGEPVSILDLARRMIRLSGYGVGTEIDIEFVGGRPGERLSEELCSPDEARMPTSHPSILSLAPPPVHADVVEKGLIQLHEAVALREAEHVRDLLFALADSVPHLAPT